MDLTLSEGFYVTLPSNASKELFPDNTPSCYTVDLAKPIELKGQWVVGLCEIVYPHTWYNVPSDLSYVDMKKITDDLGEPLVILKFGRGGYYDRPKEILEQLAPVIRRYDPTFNASYNDVTKCIDFQGSGQYKIRAFSPLAYMLGLREREWWTLSNRRATYPCDLRTGIYNLFVYTDIIQYQAVGDSYSPLLGTVKVAGTFGDVINIRHQKIHYLPLSKNCIKSIRIEIKTDRNRCVDFIFGKSIVKLHFKPASSHPSK